MSSRAKLNRENVLQMRKSHLEDVDMNRYEIRFLFYAEEKDPKVQESCLEREAVHRLTADLASRIQLFKSKTVTPEGSRNGVSGTKSEVSRRRGGLECDEEESVVMRNGGGQDLNEGSDVGIYGRRKVLTDSESAFIDENSDTLSEEELHLCSFNRSSLGSDGLCEEKCPEDLDFSPFGHQCVEQTDLCSECGCLEMDGGMTRDLKYISESAIEMIRILRRNEGSKNSLQQLTGSLNTFGNPSLASESLESFGEITKSDLATVEFSDFSTDTKIFSTSWRKVNAPADVTIVEAKDDFEDCNDYFSQPLLQNESPSSNRGSDSSSEAVSTSRNMVFPSSTLLTEMKATQMHQAICFEAQFGRVVHLHSQGPQKSFKSGMETSPLQTVILNRRNG